MLRFLKNLAKKEVYEGIVLVADVNTPAYDFYLEEGFVVEKKFDLGEN